METAKIWSNSTHAHGLKGCPEPQRKRSSREHIRLDRPQLPKYPKITGIRVRLTGLIIFCICLSILFLNEPPSAQHEWISMSRGNDLDAIAMIIAGPAARNPIIVNVLKSIRTNGKWEGPIYILTDSINCLTKIKHEVEFTAVQILKLSHDNVHVEASMLKCRLLKYLPASIETVLYMDVDIVTKGNLGPFLDHAMQVMSQPRVTMALFEDMGGHTFGMCKDCDKWHTGIIAMKRTISEPCLEAWCDELSYSKDFNQVAIGKIDSDGRCKGIGSLGAKYLHSARDYFSILGSHVFVHYTSLLNPDRLERWERRYYTMELGHAFSNWDPNTKTTINCDR